MSPLHQIAKSTRVNEESLTFKTTLAPQTSDFRNRLITPTTGKFYSQTGDPYDPCGYEYGWACRDARLPVVTVTGSSSGGPVVVDMSELYFFLDHYPSLLDFITEYDNGPYCDNYNDMFYALGDEITEMEQNEADLQAAMNEVTGYVCDPALTKDGLLYCVDLFIQTKRAAFIMAGDDRQFDPKAPVKASRAQIYFDPARCAIRTTVNTSRVILPGPLNDTTIYQPHRLNKVNAVRLADGGCQITWVLYNGFCDNAGVRPVCPAIDGQMIIHQAADGSWATNIEEDKYPSRGIYLWNGSTFVKACPNCERAETIFLDLYSLRKNTDSLRLEQSRIPKPSNCEPQ